MARPTGSPLRTAAAAFSDRIAELAFLLRNPPGRHAPISRTAGVRDLEKALALAIEFIKKCQRPDGAFVDFLLPPGASDIWMTAHVAWVIEDIPELTSTRSAAARYLFELGVRRGGVWGYNVRVGSDCDSTAQALMVLDRAGLQPDPAWIDRLAKTQRPSGGFPTFFDRNNDGWRTEHADVTLVVVEALRRLDAFPSSREAALSWLGRRAAAGALCAYWWASPAYLLWASSVANFDLESTTAAAEREVAGCATVPDLAMLIRVLNRSAPGRALRAAVPGLLQRQHADGSWSCSPCLRLTSPAVVDAKNPEGRLYAGRRRIFSTAHAAAAVADVLRSQTLSR